MSFPHAIVDNKFGSPFLPSLHVMKPESPAYNRADWEQQKKGQ
jgi:hypothetical protein